MLDIQHCAAREHLTAGAWVRLVLREARRNRPTADADNKMAAVRRAAACSFPTGDIGEMLADIERGYQS